MSGKRRRLLLAAALAGFVGPAALAFAPLPRASADAACANFTAVGASQGVQGKVDHSGFIVDEEDVDVPAAQAVVDSLGDSGGYAAEPYPGSSVLTALGLTPVPASDYPAVAQSSYPTQPHTAVSAPGVSLTADSQSLSSSADATSGGQSGTAASVGALAATALARCGGDGTVTANAVSNDQGLSFDGGVLRMGVVDSGAKAVTGGDGKDLLSAELDAGQITVGGQSAELTPAGLVANGSGTSLPSVDPLNQVLSAAGITVTYLAERRDPDGNGIVSPGMAVTLTHQGYGAQPTDVTYVFGQSYARALNGAAAGGFAASGLNQTSTPAGGTAQASSSVITGGTMPVVPSASSGVQQPLGSAGEAATPTLGNLSTTPAAMPAAPSGVSTRGRPTSQQVVLPAAVDVSALSLYAMIVLGGVLIFGMTLLFRSIGLKLKWI